MSGLARERGTGNMNDVLIIGIAGGSGSGKTTLTNQIASQFQEHVTVLKHDNYYKAHDDMTYEERTSLNYDHPNAFDTELMIEHIDAMLEVYKKDCNRSPEGQRRYRVIYWMYLSEDESKTAEDIAEMENVVVRTVFRDIKTAYEELAVLFFGIDGVRFSEQ